MNKSSDANRSWPWDVAKVNALVSDQNHAATFFCGDSRNANRFVDLFDEVVVLEIDLETLNRRLAVRPKAGWGERPKKGSLLREYNMRKK